MSKMSTKNAFTMPDIEILKSSYKLNHPKEISWVSLGQDLKIGLKTQMETSQDYNQCSEEFSCNPFAKTKVLFKSKNADSSVLEQDLTNQYIFSDQKYYESRKTEQGYNHFEFESFGRHENYQKQNSTKQNDDHQFKDDVHNKTKQWNSNSLQINFEKVRKDSLCLPDTKKPQNRQKIFGLTKIESSDQSIKQFCFRLNESTQEGSCIPVKKWSEMKEKRLLENNLSMEKSNKNDRNKQAIKSLLLNFVKKIDSLASEDISSELVQEIEELLKNFGKTQRKSIKQTSFYVNGKTRLKSIEKTGSSTIKNSFSNNKSTIKHDRKEKPLQTQYKQHSKFRLYQTKSICKSTKNLAKQDQRFRN